MMSGTSDTFYMDTQGKNTPAWHRAQPWIIGVLWLGTLAATWFFASTFNGPREGEVSSYQLLNPRLQEIKEDEEEEYRARALINLQPLRQELLSMLGDGQGNVAFFIENLNTGARAMWQERERFIPASLLKVPLAIAVMKKVESGGWDLEQTKLTLEAHFKDRYFGSLWREPDGSQFSVDYLIKQMLQYSDNTATNMLYGNLEAAERDDVYYHIGLANPEAPFEVAANRPLFQTLTARDLATFFRALYNSTYITRHSSQYLLSVLTETQFDKVLPTETPSDTVIAHKVANFFTKDPNRPKNYHDCGIVYQPDRPYLFCFMTRSLVAEDAQALIVKMANMTHRYFAQYRTQ
jgi:beta-lactamase class A